MTLTAAPTCNMRPNLRAVGLPPTRPARRPARPRRTDEATGLTIPLDCYVWRPATARRAAHWALDGRRVAAWRSTVHAPAPEPEPVLPAPAPVPASAGGDRRGVAERAAVGVFHIVTFYGVTHWLLTVAPAGVAIGVGLLVVGMTFALLDGLFVHAPVRRWSAIALMAAVGIYGSAATWRADLAGEGADSLRAREAHAALEARIYRPLVAAADAAAAAADAAEGECEDEVSGRGRRAGYGPKAEVKCGAARRARAEADTAVRARDALAPFFGPAVASADPAELHAAAVAAAGVAGVEPPPRGAYVEPELLVPALRAWEGEPAACVGFALALGIDFVGIVLLGTAIRHRRRH